MIAGVTPMPPIPNAASRGTAATSADNGTISNPNSAIDGIVCSRFKTAKTGPCRPGRLAAATPSGKPIAAAPRPRLRPVHMAHQRVGKDLAMDVVFAARATARRICRLAASSSTPEASPATAASCATMPAPRRCSASPTARAAQAPRTQNAGPSEMRAAGLAPCARRLAACPAAASTSSSSAAANTATAQWSGLLGRIRQAAANAAPSTAMPAVGRVPAAAHNGIGLPETSRFGASPTKPDSATAASRNDHQYEQHLVVNADRKERTQGGGRPDRAGRSRQEMLRFEIGDARPLRPPRHRRRSRH